MDGFQWSAIAGAMRGLLQERTDQCNSGVVGAKSRMAGDVGVWCLSVCGVCGVYQCVVLISVCCLWCLSVCGVNQRVVFVVFINVWC